MPTPIGLAGSKGAGKDTAFTSIQEWAAERGVLARRRSFADALKLSFTRMFLPDCSIDEAVIWCDEIKFTGELAITWGTHHPHGTSTEILHRVSGRTALQRFGTEGHRDVFGDNFWVDILFPLASQQVGTRPPAREELTIDAYDPTGMMSPPGGTPAGYNQWRRDMEKQGVPVFELQYARNFMGPLDQQPPEICVAADERFDNEAQRIVELQGYNIKIVRPGLEDDGDSHASEAGISDALITVTIINDGTLDEFRAKIFAWCDLFLSPVYPSEN